VMNLPEIDKGGLVSASQTESVSILPRRTLYIHTVWLARSTNIPTSFSN
jgi:hypothetical protein